MNNIHLYPVSFFLPAGFNFNRIFFTIKNKLMNKVSFNERHSRGIRLWHWATVLAMSFQLLTAFTAKFLFNNIQLSRQLNEQLQKYDVHLSGEKVWDTTRVLKETIWTTHIVFGYILAGLLLFRIVVEIFQPHEEKFAQRMKNAVFGTKNKQSAKTSRHYLLVKIIYLLAYILIATLSVTGVWMSLKRHTSLYFTEQFHRVKEIHEMSVNFLLLFMIIHLVGVIRAERGKYRNVVSGMIHGGKD
jgi:cytochrome b